MPTIKRELAAPRVEPTRRQGRPQTDPSPPVQPTSERPQRLVKGGAAAARPLRTRDSQSDKTLADTESSKARRELRNAPTLLVTPAITPELVAKAAQPGPPAHTGARSGASRNAKTAPEIKAVAPASEPRQGKRKVTGGFSETDWFLAPIDPDLVDEASGKVKVDPNRYKRNPAIPEEKRRRFSLGSSDEE